MEKTDIVAKADRVSGDAHGISQEDADFLAMMPEYQKLKPKQARFVAEYARDWNAGAAAVRCGYTKHAGRGLLEQIQVATCIAKLRSHQILERAVPLPLHLHDLKVLREEAREDKQYNAAVQAEIHRGKAVGHYEPRWRHSRHLEDRPDAEIANRVAQLLGVGVGQVSRKLLEGGD